jgi:dienelactone hydrolase
VYVPVTRADGDERVLPVVLVYDMEAIARHHGGRPAGLVIYSLGYTSCTSAVDSLGAQLAARGYVLAIPRHDDIFQVCQVIEDIPGTGTGGGDGVADLPEPADLAAYAGLDGEKMVPPEQVDNLFEYRRQDVHETLRHLRGEARYEFGSLQSVPLYLVGYSLGGWTVLSVAGAAEGYGSYRNEIRAVICQAPYVGELRSTDLQKVNSPILYMTGTEDDFLPGTRDLYTWRRERSSMVEILGADHFLFAVDLCASPLLAGSQPTSCTEDAYGTANRVNALVVEFIAKMGRTTALPDVGSFQSFDPKFFRVLPRRPGS